MDLEEREKQRKKQFIKVLIAEVGMVISVIAIVLVATLASMGFFVGENGSIEQTGLVQIHSLPTGATTEVDGGVLFARTNLSRSLTPGEHSVKLSREGYDSWQKQIKMYSGMLIRLYYPRLFLKNRQPEVVMNWEKELAFFSPADNQTSILYGFEKSAELHWVSTRGDEAKETVLDLSKILPEVTHKEFNGRIEQIKWNRNGDQVLLRVLGSERAEWILVNLKDVTNSLNLTRTFGMEFSQVEMIDDSAAQLFVLENQHLRKINVADQAISRVLLDKVIEFASDDNDVAYVATRKQDEKEEKVVGVYRDGEKGGTIMGTVPAEKTVHVALSEYYSEDYLLYTVDDEATVYYGTFPNYSEKAQETDFSGMKVLLGEQKLSATPEKINVSIDGEYFVMRKGKNFMVVDVDMGDLFEYEAPSGQLNWLGTSMMSSTADGVLRVWDFDNTNRRVLVKTKVQTNDVEAQSQEAEPSVTTEIKTTLEDFPIAVSANDRWVYYVVRGNVGLSLVREKLRD